eukprot:2677123-Amphidinium_carterae.1
MIQLGATPAQRTISPPSPGSGTVWAFVATDVFAGVPTSRQTHGHIVRDASLFFCGAQDRCWLGTIGRRSFVGLSCGSCGLTV